MPTTTKPCDASRGPIHWSWNHQEKKPGAIATTP